MNTLANLDKPPFFAAVYLTPDLTPGFEADAGLHSEAAATITALAMILHGFVGFRDDVAAGGRPVKIVYWRTYRSMAAWKKTCADLIPHRVKFDDCVASEGCLWHWLDDLDQPLINRPARAA